MLLLDDKYDKAMTEVFYKSGIKCDNNYIDNGLVKQCKCETNETKSRSEEHTSELQSH